MRSRRDVVVLTLLFIVSLPAVTARLYSSDEVEYFSYLRSLWFDRDVSFENEYQYFYDHRIAQSADFHHTFLELETATGRRINYGTMGCAILWSPFYAGADLTTRFAGALPSSTAAVAPVMGLVKLNAGTVVQPVAGRLAPVTTPGLAT